MKPKNLTQKQIAQELLNINYQLKKINYAISFELRYGRFNPLTSSLQTKKENLQNKKLKLIEMKGGNTN